MFLKDQLKDTYRKASLDKNNFVLENVINIWAHRFGVHSIDELIVKEPEEISLKEEDLVEGNQEEISLKEEDLVEGNKEQFNLKLLDNSQYKSDLDSEPKKEAKFNNEILQEEIFESHKNNSEDKDIEELPLPHINNLRKWINNKKKAS